MAEVTGRLMSLSLDGATLGYSTDFDISMDTAIIDVTSRSSSQWRSLLRGTRAWTITFSGFYVDTDVGKKVLQDWVDDATDADITVILTLADGTITLSGSALLSNLTYTGPFAGGATYSGTLEGTSTLTQSSS
jgi:predicted secreted protein